MIQPYDAKFLNKFQTENQSETQYFRKQDSFSNQNQRFNSFIIKHRFKSQHLCQHFAMSFPQTFHHITSTNRQTSPHKISSERKVSQQLPEVAMSTPSILVHVGNEKGKIPDTKDSQRLFVLPRRSNQDTNRRTLPTGKLSSDRKVSPAAVFVFTSCPSPNKRGKPDQDQTTCEKDRDNIFGTSSLDDFCKKFKSSTTTRSRKLGIAGFKWISQN